MTEKEKEKPTFDSFEWGEELGEGAFGTVRRAKLKSTGEEFAIKILEKKHVIKMDKVKYVTSERDILFQLNHPNIIKLHHTFQDASSLYFVMELAPGGELFEQIQKHGPASLKCAQFYAAELVTALEYLHSKGIVHRDLKPENMLVAADGHIKISDFGSATKQTTIADMNKTFVGTAEYVSPEVLNNQQATQNSDLWALGCVIYQLLAGVPPFKGETDYIIFQKILNRQFEYPANFPETAKNLVNQLIVLKPESRLGASGNLNLIKSHQFFAGIDFTTLHEQVPPPYKEEKAVSHASQDTATKYKAFESFNRPPLEIVEIQNLVQQQATTLSIWKPFLFPNEVIILTDILNKRVGLFARPRQFLLTSFPRLIYIQTDKMEQKGEIPWSSITSVELRNSTTLYVHTPTRVYYLEEVERPNDWIEAINFLKKSS